MATVEKIRNDIAKTKEKIAELQKRLRTLEAQLAEEENLEIVRMVKAVCAMTLLQVRRTGPLLNRRAIRTRPQNERGSLWAMTHRQG